MRRIALLAVAALLSGPAFADDDDAGQQKIARRFDVAFGTSVVSDYIDGGESLSGGDPSFKVFVEPSYGMIYGGVSFATVKLNAEDEDDDDDGDDGGEDALAALAAGDAPSADIETILYYGVRPQFGPLELDVGVEHKFYHGLSEADESALHAEAEYEFNERFSAETEVEYGIDEDSWEVEGQLNFKPLEKLTLFAGVGHEWEEDEDVTFWSAGTEYRFNDVFAGTLAYRGADNGLSKIVAGLSLKTSLSALNGGPARDDD